MNHRILGFPLSGKYLLRLVFAIAALQISLVSTAQIPTGYYNTAVGKTGQTLQIALYNIIRNHNVIGYTPGVWNAFYSTDAKSNGKVWDMYTDIPGGTPVYEFYFGDDQCGQSGGGTEGDCYSREHSFPSSWFGGSSPMYTDLFHIFPTDQYVNNAHSDNPMAKVGTATFISTNGSKKGNCITPGYTGTVFEPIDAYKGDFARAYFYMATRYQNVIATWSSNNANADAILNETSYPAFETWYLNLLLSWHTADPVSAKEIARNDSIYKIQLNRNPYIDHPEYVNAVWAPSGPKPEPTNHVTAFSATTGNPSYSVVTLTWTDATGTVLPDGYLIRGSAVGYSSIEVPVDGTPVPDGGLNKNISSGVQSCTFSGLLPNTTYYFRIFPFTNYDTQINYKTGGTVPSVSVTTSVGISVLQPGDIAIIEVQTSDPDKISFITFKQLNQGTVINFSDNGFTSPTTVRTGEGFLTFTALSVIPAGTVISWYNGMPSGAGWGTPSNFSLSTSGDQVFAYQGVWGTSQTMIYGAQTGNSAWLTSGSPTSNTSYLPASLTNYSTAVTFAERNGNYNLITTGTINALGSLISYPDNWTRSASVLPTPAWTFSLNGQTIIHQAATVSDFKIGLDESLVVQPGILFRVEGDMIIY